MGGLGRSVRLGFVAPIAAHRLAHYAHLFLDGHEEPGVAVVVGINHPGVQHLLRAIGLAAVRLTPHHRLDLGQAHAGVDEFVGRIEVQVVLRIVGAAAGGQAQGEKHR